MIDGAIPDGEWIRRRWRLAAVGAPPSAPQMLLLPDHRIGGSDHDDRRGWDFLDGALVLRDADGAPAARFDRLSDRAGQWRLEGTALRTGAAMSLRETVPAQIWVDSAGAADPVRLRPGPAREFLVIVRSDWDSRHVHWTADVGDDERSWDLLVSWAPVEPPPDGPARGDLLCEQPMHPTAQALYRLLHPASPVWDYRYIMICDEHVMLAWSDLDRIFARMVEYGLLIAQPARRADDAVEHEITRVRPGSALRYTSFVDRATPVFERSVLRLAAPTFSDMVFGQGIEHLWSFLIGRPRNRVAILDDVVVHLTRPFASRYDLALGDDEAEVMFRSYGLDPEIREYGRIPA